MKDTKFVNVFNERWLIYHNEDASKKIVATGIFVFDFELFIGGRVQQFLTASSVRWSITSIVYLGIF